MNVIPFSVFSQVIGLGSATGTRAGLSLLAVALAARLGKVALPPELLWMASVAAMAGFAVVTAFEYLTYRDDDMQLLLGAVHYGLTGSSGALVVVAMTAGSTQELSQLAIGTGGAVLAVTSLAFRRWLYAKFAELESELFRPRNWLNWLEEGGVIGLCVAIFLAPYLALAIVLLAVVAGFTAGYMSKQLEARFRRPCPACNAPIRQEASRCPGCRAEVPVAKTLELGLGGRKAQQTLRHAVASVTTTAERLKRRGTL